MAKIKSAEQLCKEMGYSKNYAVAFGVLSGKILYLLDHLNDEYYETSDEFKEFVKRCFEGVVE